MCAKRDVDGVLGKHDLDKKVEAFSHENTKCEHKFLFQSIRNFVKGARKNSWI